jgi:hypothetical protein
MLLLKTVVVFVGDEVLDCNLSGRLHLQPSF